MKVGDIRKNHGSVAGGISRGLVDVLIDWLTRCLISTIEKKKIGDRPAKLKEKKGHRDLEREIKKKKNKGEISLLEEQRENFVAAATK